VSQSSTPIVRRLTARKPATRAPDRSTRSRRPSPRIQTHASSGRRKMTSLKRIAQAIATRPPARIGFQRDAFSFQSTSVARSTQAVEAVRG
jgi:hypothetical protein